LAPRADYYEVNGYVTDNVIKYPDGFAESYFEVSPFKIPGHPKFSQLIEARRGGAGTIHVRQPSWRGLDSEGCSGLDPTWSAVGHDDWREAVRKLRTIKRRNTARNLIASVRDLVADSRHWPWKVAHIRGADITVNEFRWPGKAQPFRRPARHKPRCILDRQFCGPVVNIGGRLYPRSYSVVPPDPDGVRTVEAEMPFTADRGDDFDCRGDTKPEK
jgi:hypothetical protein